MYPAALHLLKYIYEIEWRNVYIYIYIYIYVCVCVCVGTM